MKDNNHSIEEIYSDVNYWRPYFDESAKIITHYFSVSDGSKLLVVESIPKNKQYKHPVMVIPGWFSRPSGWIGITKELSKDTHVFYFESREKESSIMPHKNVEFTVERMGDDFYEIISTEHINIEDCTIIASSMGGTMLFAFFHKYNIKPHKTFFLGANPTIEAPLWARLTLLRAPLFMYGPLKRFVKWYLVKFRVDSKKEPEQAEKYKDVIDRAVSWKLQKSARQVIKFNAWPFLSEINVPIIFIGAKTDKLHNAERSKKMREMMKNSEYVEFESNKIIHSEEFARYVKNSSEKI